MVPDRTARLDGFEGTLVTRGALGGEWTADLDPELLIALVQAATEGSEVPLNDAGGVRMVLIRRCWYDVESRAIRACFETAGVCA